MLSPDAVHFLRALSRLLGWIYTLAWSLSFYPQPLLNLNRRSTTGSTIDYVSLNTLGFTVYTISTAALFFSPHIRAQYAARNPVSPEPTVRANDVVFGAHAIFMCVVTVSMFWGRLWGLEQGGRVGKWRLSKGVAGLMVGVIVGVGFTVLRVVKDGDGARTGGWQWIDVVYAFGYAKLVITVVKYIPQAWANYKRKSTTGWSIDQMLLDLTGGIFSIAQLVIDSSLQNDWSGLTGNPVKLVLGNVSICFDILFITQHYWLYRGARGVVGEAGHWKGDVEDERTSLLDHGDARHQL
ncbi:hypothetical protein MMC13_007726 [Lambiella insularis]|nr:hypothetical protein [Lambiella insularis]